MRIRKTKHNLAWLQYHPIGHLPEQQENILNKKPRTPENTKAIKIPNESIHQLIKFIPNLASLLNPIRPLLKKENIINNKIQWSDKHTDALNSTKNQITKITEQKYFDKEKPNRVKCDASHKGLGATLEQWDPDGWFPIAYASRFLNPAEQKTVLTNSSS